MEAWWEAMVRRCPLYVAYYTSRRKHCCGDIALGGLFRAEQCKETTLCAPEQ